MRHPQIHQGDVRPEPTEEIHHLPAVACLPDYRHVGLHSDDRCETLTNDHVVVGQKYFYRSRCTHYSLYSSSAECTGTLATTSAPSPGLELMDHSPRRR